MYCDRVDNINTFILAGGSEYHKHPEIYNIRFSVDKDDIHREHRYVVPTNLWHSEEPYIDQNMRVRRLDRVCRELHSQGVNIGPYAVHVAQQLTERG